MSGNIDLNKFLTKAEKFTHKAINLGLNNQYEKSIKNSERSIEILKMLLSELNNSKITETNRESKEYKELLEKIYQLYAKNFDNMKMSSLLLKDPEEALKYSKTAENYLSKYLKISNNPQRYNPYLSFLYTSALIYRKVRKPELELKYVRKYIETFYEALKLGFKFDSDLLVELQLTFNLYISLIRENPISVVSGWELLETIIFDFLKFDYVDGLKEEEKSALSMWLPFAVDTLNIIATENPNIIADNESLVLTVMEYVNDSMIIAPSAIFYDEEVVERILKVIRKYHNLFKKLDSLKRFAQMSTEMFKRVLNFGSVESIVLAINNTIDFYESNPEVSSAYKLLKLYTRLFNFHNQARDFDSACKYYEIIFLLLDSLDAEDTIEKESSINQYNVEDKFNILKTETYYYLSNNELDLNHREESKKFLKKAKESIAKLSDKSNQTFTARFFNELIKILECTINNDDQEN